MAPEPENDDHESEHDSGDGESPATRPVEAPALLKRWIVACFVVAVAASAGALGLYFAMHAKWPREAPRLDLRYEGAAHRLSNPPNVSPSEEYPGPDGETVFLTQDEFKAVNQVAALPNDVARKLAAALGERDPNRRVERLFELVNGVPSSPEGDKQAMVLYRMATAALSATPGSPAREDVKSKLDRMIGCRFVGPRVPPCADRPSNTPLWGLAALAIGSLTLALFGLVSALLARRRAMKEEDAVAPRAASGDELEEGA